MPVLGIPDLHSQMEALLRLFWRLWDFPGDLAFLATCADGNDARRSTL
jgi:hypothetical protein